MLVLGCSFLSNRGNNLLQLTVERPLSFLLKLLVVKDENNLAVSLLAQIRDQAKHVIYLKGLSPALQIVDANDLIAYGHERNQAGGVATRPLADKKKKLRNSRDASPIADLQDIILQRAQIRFLDATFQGGDVLENRELEIV